MAGTGAMKATNGTAGAKPSSANPGLCRPLIQSRVGFTFSSPGSATEKQNLFQVGAVHRRADQEQHDSGENGNRSPTPGVPPDQGGCHAKRSQRYQRLTGLVRHGAGAPATLAKWRHTAGLPRIEKDGEAEKRDQNADQDWELFQSHDRFKCKKGARSRAG